MKKKKLLKYIRNFFYFLKYKMANPGLKFAPRDSRKNRSRTASYHFFFKLTQGGPTPSRGEGARGANVIKKSL